MKTVTINKSKGRISSLTINGDTIRWQREGYFLILEEQLRGLSIGDLPRGKLFITGDEFVDDEMIGDPIVCSLSIEKDGGAMVSLTVHEEMGEWGRILGSAGLRQIVNHAMATLGKSYPTFVSVDADSEPGDPFVLLFGTIIYAAKTDEIFEIVNSVRRKVASRIRAVEKRVDALVKREIGSVQTERSKKKP
jgi:hypothetical protein